MDSHSWCTVQNLRQKYNAVAIFYYSKGPSHSVQQRSSLMYFSCFLRDNGALKYCILLYTSSQLHRLSEDRFKGPMLHSFSLCFALPDSREILTRLIIPQNSLSLQKTALFLGLRLQLQLKLLQHVWKETDTR